MTWSWLQKFYKIQKFPLFNWQFLKVNIKLTTKLYLINRMTDGRLPYIPQSIKTSYSLHHPCLKNMPRLAAKTCVMPEHWANNQLPNFCSNSLTEIDRESETYKSSKSCSLPCLSNQNIFPSKRLFSPHKNDAYKKKFIFNFLLFS